MRIVKKVKIENKVVGYGEPCFIIAEAGVNHNGALEKALQLIDIAADAGADAVKFQTFRAEQVVIDSGEMVEYQRKNIGEVKSQREMLRELELDESYYPQLISRCRERGILFLSTPHGGKESVDLLESLNVSAYKVGSGDLTNYILLEKLAETARPIILSSGMADIEEIKGAVDFLRNKGAEDLVVLHCTTNYPTPPEEVNLAAMGQMMEELDTVIGYSDHTEGDEAAIIAVTLGAAVYERHFTIDKSLPGPDHVASDNPEELRRKIQAIRRVSVLLGSGEKLPTKSEFESMRTLVRKSIVAARAMAAGHVIAKEDLEAKRPADGTSPIEFERFIGRKIKHEVPADHQLKFEDIQ